MVRDWFHRACVETCLELFFKIAPTQVEAICKGLRIHFQIRDLRRIAGVTNLALGFQNVSSPTWPCFCPLARSRVSCVIARDHSIFFFCGTVRADRKTRGRELWGLGRDLSVSSSWLVRCFCGVDAPRGGSHLRHFAVGATWCAVALQTSFGFCGMSV